MNIFEKRTLGENCSWCIVSNTGASITVQSLKLFDDKATSIDASNITFGNPMRVICADYIVLYIFSNVILLMSSIQS